MNDIITAFVNIIHQHKSLPFIGKEHIILAAIQQQQRFHSFKRVVNVFFFILLVYPNESFEYPNALE